MSLSAFRCVCGSFVLSVRSLSLLFDFLFWLSTPSPLRRPTGTEENRSGVGQRRRRNGKKLAINSKILLSTRVPKVIIKEGRTRTRKKKEKGPRRSRAREPSRDGESGGRPRVPLTTKDVRDLQCRQALCAGWSAEGEGEKRGGEGTRGETGFKRDRRYRAARECAAV